MVPAEVQVLAAEMAVTGMMEVFAAEMQVLQTPEIVGDVLNRACL